MKVAANFRSLPPPPLFEGLPLTGEPLFDRAIPVIFHHEGISFTNDPDDPGGPTVFGITLATAKALGDLDGDGYLDLDLDGDGDVDANDLKLLQPEEALHIYKKQYWDPYPYSRLPEAIAVKTFDFSVNMGPKQSHKILQRSIRAVLDVRLVEDGIIGKRTLEAVQSIHPAALLSSLRSEAAGFYRLLAQIRPKSRKYREGWLNRAYY